MTQAAIQQAAAILKAADSACVLSGAGVSKESGVPTFRDAQEGLWAKYDPTELATPNAYRKNPKLVWDWYEFRRGMVADVKPNPGHIALAALEKHFSPFPIITQNVDDLHEQAGSTSVTHLHGNIAGHKCFHDCHGKPTRVDIRTLEFDPDDGPPECPHCGRKSLRADVVWFGEMLPEDDLAYAMHVCAESDVIIVVGTSGLVTPAASLPRLTKEGGGKVIEVNPDYSMITRIADVKLEGPSGDMLPKLVAAMG
ncbi:MAG: NAD-dependent deacylase [Chloroflexota bacterium]